MLGPPLDDVVLVIAHPDDECMFFYPTIARATTLHIVCLSDGGYDGLGKKREEELRRAAARLGATATCVNDARLRDGPHAWDAAVVEEVVRPLLHEEALVVTFDRGGASGHANHVACYHGAAAASKGPSRRREQRSRRWRGGRKRHAANVQVHAGVRRIAQTERTGRFYALETAPHYRRYIGCFDVACAWLRARLAARRSLLVASVDVRGCYAALAAHASQLVWFRRLSVVFSAYTYANRLVAIE